MVEEKTRLLEQAARCRRLAQTVNDVEFAGRKWVMAQEYEEEAFTLLSPPLAPSEGTQMTHPDQKDIERRAYQLWEAAGQPEGRDQEFYLEAERQLKEERIRHELKTPDNL
jgi:Protein of unknown function (DUF2934)